LSVRYVNISQKRYIITRNQILTIWI